jgi:hypothetical protein
LDSVNLGFAAAAFFALCFTLIVTLLNFDFKLRDSHISESEKRLFMFYFPMLKLIESISDNYCYIQDDHKNRIKEISQYRYLMNVDNTDLKDHFMLFESALGSKTCLDTQDRARMNLLLDLLKRDILTYEREIEAQLAKV